MNLANKLTIFRMILVLVMVIIALINPQGNLWGIPLTFILMDVVFIVASITDKLDGYIARSRNQITTFGKFLDPIADKILVLTAMIYLVGFGKIPACQQRCSFVPKNHKSPRYDSVSRRIKEYYQKI